MFSSEKITCSDMQNVELFYTKLNSGVGIRTSLGNIKVSTCNDIDYFTETEQVIACFETTLSGNKYLIIYTETDIEGKLYYTNSLGSNTHLLESGLIKTGQANGCDFSAGFYDMFVFTNGVEIKFIYTDANVSGQLPKMFSNSFDGYNYYPCNIENGIFKSKSENATIPTDTFELAEWTLYYDNQGNAHSCSIINSIYYERISKIKLIDQEKRTIKGIGLAVYDSRLWIFNNRNLWYSAKGTCYDFTYNQTEFQTSAGFIELVKPITAICNYENNLVVFHKDCSSLIKTVQNANTVDSLFAVNKDYHGGCANFNSFVLHGANLFFYDDTKKGVFSFTQTITGDINLSNNLALDVQAELMEISDVDKIRTVSAITSERDEIWFLVPILDDNEHSIILIFDYLRGEWIKRKCQKINSMFLYQSKLYSAGKDIYAEYESSLFNGEHIPSHYTCTYFNLGADNTLKITKFPPRLTCTSDYLNNFLVSYTKNYNTIKSPKIKKLHTKGNKNILIFDDGISMWDDDINDGQIRDENDEIISDKEYYWANENANAIIKMPSASFKALEIKFYTETVSQDFSIMNIEFSKIKVKQV